MVDRAANERLATLRRVQLDTGWSKAEISRRMNLTQQAIGKWFKTGQISGANLAALLALAYPHRVAARRDRLPADIEEADDVIDKQTVQQIFAALPRDERAKWIEYGNLLVERHAPRGAANPHSKKPPTKVKARGTQ